MTDTVNDNDNLTFDSLKERVLKEYPPPRTKAEFKLSLSSMLMHKNEDPNLAYSRFKYKLSLIKQAIDTINTGIWAETCELYPGDDDDEEAEAHYYQKMISQISDEDKHEALIRMFVIRNNKPQWNNDGKINALVYKYVLKKDPNSMESWNLCFQSMKRELIPRILDGQQEYEYQPYPIDENCDSIYSQRKTQSNAKLQPSIPSTNVDDSTENNKRKRTQDDNDGYEPSNKKRRLDRYKKCHRCRRIGHIARDCFANLDADNQIIQSPAPVQREACIHCGRANHQSNNCRHKGTNNNEKKAKVWRQYGQSKDEKSLTDSASNSNKQREINALNKSIERSQQMSALNQSDPISIIDTFKQWISNNDHIDDVQAQEFQCFADDMAHRFQSE